MSTDASSTNDVFTAYLRRRAAASDAFVAGDVGPLLEVSTSTVPASIFGPAGTVVIGPQEVNAVNTDGASHFSGSEHNDLEVAHAGSDGDLGYWTGVQRSLVTIAGRTSRCPSTCASPSSTLPPSRRSPQGAATADGPTPVISRGADAQSSARATPGWIWR